MNRIEGELALRDQLYVNRGRGLLVVTHVCREVRDVVDGLVVTFFVHEFAANCSIIQEDEETGVVDVGVFVDFVLKVIKPQLLLRRVRQRQILLVGNRHLLEVLERNHQLAVLDLRDHQIELGAFLINRHGAAAGVPAELCRLVYVINFNVNFADVRLDICSIGVSQTAQVSLGIIRHDCRLHQHLFARRNRILQQFRFRDIAREGGAEAHAVFALIHIHAVDLLIELVAVWLKVHRAFTVQLVITQIVADAFQIVQRSSLVAGAGQVAAEVAGIVADRLVERQPAALDRRRVKVVGAGAIVHAFVRKGAR